MQIYDTIWNCTLLQIWIIESDQSIAIIFFIFDESLNSMLQKCQMDVNPFSINPTKWPNTLKQLVDKLPTNCLSVFGLFVKFAHKRLKDPTLIISFKV